MGIYVIVDEDLLLERLAKLRKGAEEVTHTVYLRRADSMEQAVAEAADEDEEVVNYVGLGELVERATVTYKIESS